MTDTSKNGHKRTVLKSVRTPIDWYQVDAAMIRAFVNACTAQGYAAIFGKTLNGRALSVCVLAGEFKERDYINALDDAYDVLTGLLMTCDIDLPVEWTS